MLSLTGSKSHQRMAVGLWAIAMQISIYIISPEVERTCGGRADLVEKWSRRQLAEYQWPFDRVNGVDHGSIQRDCVIHAKTMMGMEVHWDHSALGVSKWTKKSQPFWPPPKSNGQNNFEN